MRAAEAAGTQLRESESKSKSKSERDKGLTCCSVLCLRGMRASKLLIDVGPAVMLHVSVTGWCWYIAD